MSEPAPVPPPNTAAKFQSSPTFISVINELNVNQDQLLKRQAIIRDIEKLLSERFGATNRLLTYMMRFGHPRSQISSADIAHFESVLSSVTGAQQLNVVLHSPGGDGTIIEKMVGMCRNHLAGENRKLRVIVPNLAKSAATVFALGSDTILMGYCSELGPIDPQVQIAVSGVIHWVSALAFVESRDTLMKQIAEAIEKKESTVGLLQQIAGLNVPFTQEMENAIYFAQKTAANLLNRYMLVSRIKDKRARRTKANKIAKKLVSKELFPVHAQFIDGATAKSKLELEVEVLQRDDELWKMIWDYYIRCEVQMNMPLQAPFIKIKLFESAATSLVTQDTVN